MLYVHTALKSEAQAFVDRYKLTKRRLDQFTFYTNATMCVIISGIGIEQTQKSLGILTKYFPPASDDIFINVGICAASYKYTIGELIEVACVKHKDQTYTLKHHINTYINCVDTPQFTSEYEIVDMESFGFYTALKDKTQHLHIFKVVSDHFEPHKVNKEDTKKLIFNAIDAINNKIKVGL